MVIFGDTAILGSINESTMIRNKRSFSNKFPLQEFQLEALKESQNMFAALIETDFTQGAMNANIITESVGIALLEEQKENIFQRFWNWLKGLCEKLCNAIKGLYEKVVNFFKKKKVTSSEAVDILEAFKTGNLSNIHFNNFIDWNVSAFDQVTESKFANCITDMTSDLVKGFEEFSRGERKANSMKEIYFNKLPLIENKKVTSTNLTEVMEEIFIKSRGTKEGLSDQEKQAFLDFHAKQNSYQETFRKIEQNFNGAYAGLKRKMEEFIEARSVQDTDSSMTKLKKKASEIITKKIQFCSSMVNAFYSAVTQYLNTYSGILMKANNTITSTIEAGGKAVLKAKNMDSSENSNNTKKEDKDDKKKVNVKGSKKRRPQNASFVFEDPDNITFEEAVAYLEESEEEYEDFMSCEFVA